MSANFLNFVKQYSLYSVAIIAPLGLIGNVINILVFTQFKLFRGNRSAFYLTVESISGFLYLSLSIVVTSFTSIYGDDATGRSPIWCKLRYMLAQTAVLTTYYMISCAAVDQFFSTNYSPHLRQMCTLKLARCITSAMVFVCIAHSIVFGMFFDVQPPVGCIISNQIFLQYASFVFYPILGGLLPIVIASFFSLLAYQNVRRIVRRQLPVVRRRLDQQMTAMVLIRVVLFVCLALPYSCFRIYVINYPVSQNQSIEYAIRLLLQAVFTSSIMLNYMMSFYAFTISSARFRRQVKSVLVKKYWRKLKNQRWFSNNEVAPENAPSENMELENDL